jgi:hypothetical protein
MEWLNEKLFPIDEQVLTKEALSANKGADGDDDGMEAYKKATEIYGNVKTILPVLHMIRYIF